MNRKITWLTILTISLISILILSVGFITSLRLTNATKSNKTEKAVESNNVPANKSMVLDTKDYNILVLGDSLAKGTGDEKGKGFSNYFADLWKSNAKKEVKINNFAVNGDISSGLLKIVQNEDTLKAVQNSQIIFVSIGGNEVKRFQGSSAIEGSQEVKTAEENYSQNIKSILKLLRDKNKNSIIVFIGLYNPYGKNIASDKLDILNDWNYMTQQLVSSDSNSIFIPTYDLFRYNLDKYLSADNFHPNSTGYEAISKRIYEALLNYK